MKLKKKKMAKLDPKGNLRGILGPSYTRVVNGVNIIQSKGRTPKQTPNTKKAASAFGYASRNSKIIRLAICDFLGKNYDHNLFRRFTGATLQLLQKNKAYPLNKCTFFNTNMQGLIGFDFNSHSPFSDSCTLPISIKTKDGKAILHLDSFTVADYFNFPAYASEARLDFTLLNIGLTTRSSTTSSTFSIDFAENETVDPQVWETALTTAPNFAVMIAEIHYFRILNKDKKIGLNNPNFHPCCLVYVNNGLL